MKRLPKEVNWETDAEGWADYINSTRAASFFKTTMFYIFKRVNGPQKLRNIFGPKGYVRV